MTGDAVANGKYGLTAEQQEFFSTYRTVVATPIWEDGVRRFGVLSAISPAETDYFDDPTGGGQAALRELADTLGVEVQTIPFRADIQFLTQGKGAVSQ